MDIGAYDNLMGDQWLQRMNQKVTRAGLQITSRPLTKCGRICGVGTGSPTVNMEATVPIGIPELDIGAYTGPVMENSEVPALLGLRTLQGKHAIIDTKRKLLYVSPDPQDLRAISGSSTTIIKLESAPSGHLLIPCTEFSAAQHKAAKNNKKTVSFGATLDK